MNIVDVDEMEKNHEQKNFFDNMDEKYENKAIKTKKKNNNALKNLKAIKSKPQKEIKEPKIKIDSTFIKSTDEIIFNVLAIPMTDPDKRKIFKQKLREDKFVNNYIKEKIYNQYIQYLNNDTKFGIIYSKMYYDTYKSDSIDFNKINNEPKQEIKIESEEE